MDDNDNNRMNDETSKQKKNKIFSTHKNDERIEKINCLRKQEEKKKKLSFIE